MQPVARVPDSSERDRRKFAISSRNSFSMHLDRRTVSRKTPRDGKLEVSAAAAAHLGSMGTTLQAEWDGARAPAAVVTMSCTCGAGGTGHEHHFLESIVFRTLPVGEEVDLLLVDATIQVEMTPST